MRVLINCSNLRFGGGKTVGVNIVRQLIKVKENNYLLITPDDIDYNEFDSVINLERVVIPNKYSKLHLKFFLNSVVLPKYLRKFNPNLVLSLGNIAIPTKYKQILLVHQPYFAYPKSIVWERLNWKFSVYIKLMIGQIKNNIHYANQFLVQTSAMKTRIADIYKIPVDKISLLPNAVNLTGMNPIKKFDYFDRQDEKINLIFLSKYYPHKNFEILIPLAKKIKDRKLNITITTTLNASESKDTELFLEKINVEKLTEVIKNIGNLPLIKIPNEYEKNDGLLMPTLLESFSGTYIEAMHYGRPIFTSDMDFATEICKDAAYYFNPLKADEILKIILEAFSNRLKMEEKIKKGKQYCLDFKNWNQLGEDLLEVINLVEAR